MKRRSPETEKRFGLSSLSNKEFILQILRIPVKRRLVEMFTSVQSVPT
jgi:hypothetical protein